MDSAIAKANVRDDGDLKICDSIGVAFQSDMAQLKKIYDNNYLSKVQAYEGTPIACAVNKARCEMVSRYLDVGSAILDVGAGSGDFMFTLADYGFIVRGYEVIPSMVQRLQVMGLYSNEPSDFDGITVWDTLEHMEHPEEFLECIGTGIILFVSIPVFDDLDRIRESKHYRPDEHLYYWTPDGFKKYMQLHGFHELERNLNEVTAGRESIMEFAFIRRA